MLVAIVLKKDPDCANQDLFGSTLKLTQSVFLPLFPSSYFLSFYEELLKKIIYLGGSDSIHAGDFNVGWEPFCCPCFQIHALRYVGNIRSLPIVSS